MLTLCADHKHLLFHVSHFPIISNSMLRPVNSHNLVFQSCTAILYSIAPVWYCILQCMLPYAPLMILLIIPPSPTHTHTHTQLCTQWVHSMVTFGCLLTVTMDREQWSSTIVALDGLAFAQTAAGVLVMPRWPADSWDMRLGGQWCMKGDALIHVLHITQP